MADARKRHEWDQTAELCAAIVNSNPFREDGAKPVESWRFNPFELRDRAKKTGRKPKAKPRKVSVSVLKSMFCGEEEEGTVDGRV